MSESAAAADTARARAFAREWKAWHLTREANLKEPFGWLSVTALHWLGTEPHRFDGVPGIWSVRGAETGGGVFVELTAGEELFIDGERVHGTFSFDVLRERQSITMRTADFAVEIARRGGHDLLRPRHPDAPALATFHGVEAFEPDQRWALRAHFVPDPHAVTVGSVLEQVQHQYTSPGTVSFEWDGQQYALTAFSGREPDTLQVLFTDATTAISTSALCRVLFIPAPEEDGTLLLDFNRAVNPPCSFTAHATCPLPPSENRLPFAVEAGETEYRA